MMSRMLESIGLGILSVSGPSSRTHINILMFVILNPDWMVIESIWVAFLKNCKYMDLIF